MAQLFPKSANALSRVGFVLALLMPAVIVSAFIVGVRTPYQTAVGVVREQPVPFSHQHHAGNLRIDCRYCHHSVEESPFAGMPASEVCMTCHSQLWTNADMLAPVRESLAFNEALRWRRINDLPDYVYFDHSIHVHKGIGCESCHGRVDQMPLSYAVRPFFMEFCLDCHRNPSLHLRPLDQITTMGWQAPTGQEALGSALLEQYHINVSQLTDCSICHR